MLNNQSIDTSSSTSSAMSSDSHLPPEYLESCRNEAFVYGTESRVRQWLCVQTDETIRPARVLLYGMGGDGVAGELDC